MADVNLDILARLDGFEKSLKELEKLGSTGTSSLNAVAKSMDKVNDNTKILGSGIGKAAVAFTAINQGIQIFKAVASAMAEPIQQASEFEDAVNELNTALALSGKFSTEASERFIEFASEIQKTTKFSDDAVLKTAALIQNLAKLDEEGLQKATTAALNLSTALRIDLNTAAQLVGKAAEGNVTAFGKMGIQIQKGKDDAETFANTLSVLGGFQGAAAAQALTFSGALAKANNNINDSLKETGKMIVQNETVIAVINAVSEVFADLAVIIEKDVVPAIGPALTEGIKISLVAMGVLLEGLENMEAQFRLASLPIKVLVEGLSGLAGSLGAFARGDFSAVFQIKDDAIKSIKDTVAAVASGETVVGKVRKRFDELSGSIFAASNREFGVETNKQLEKMSDRAKKAGKAIDEDLLKSLEGLEKTFSKAGLSQLEVIQKTGQEAIKQAQEIAKKEPELRQRSLELISKITLDTEKKIQTEKAKLQKEQRDQELKEIERQKDRVKSLASGQVQEVITELKVGGKLDTTLDFASLGAGVTKAISEGAKGAEKVVTATLGLAAEAFLPGIGPVVSQIAEVLAQGGEKVKKFVTEFVTAVPTVLATILKSVPVLVQSLIGAIPSLLTGLINEIPGIVITLVEELVPNLIFKLIDEVPQIILALSNAAPLIIDRLAEETPRIIDRMIDNIPLVIQRLAEKAPDLIQALVLLQPSIAFALAENMPYVAIRLAGMMPEIALRLAESLIKEAPGIMRSLGKNLGESFINGVIAGFESIINGFVSVINQIPGVKTDAVSLPRVKLAEGGTIPKGFSNDRFAAMLSSDEEVVNQDTSRKLRQFLDKQQPGAVDSGNDTDRIIQALSRLEQKMGQQPFVIQIGGRAITQVLREELESGRVVGL